ncbi:MAG: murein biosynthesis integral membrane protein MurJ [Bacteroidetes bacterium]|jgi:putative peptidoglycan lipid II flippase|nr:murein biosynthesis integral membrane protein MurJ [Bacteroidota bacterium]
MSSSESADRPDPSQQASGAEAEEPAAGASSSPSDSAASPNNEVSSGGASLVAGGILTSRVTGLLRERVLAYFFGVSAVMDVWTVVFRVPNILQNLLGEGTISAAFIPTYSRLIEQERYDVAGRFAGAIFGLLLATASIIAALGIVFAEPIVAVSAPGFLDDAAKVAAGTLDVDRFALSVQGIKLIFPMTGVLVLSAWALGVLNSHRRFFVPYVAPVLWNVAIMAALAGGALYAAGGFLPTGYDTDTLSYLLLIGCGGAFAGGVLQFGVQLPFVAQAMPSFSFSFSTRVEGVRDAIRAVGPVIAGRGVAQVSAFVDQVLGSAYLLAGGLSALRFGLLLYMLPISLFGISVTAAELPELSRLTGDRVNAFVDRLRRSLGQLAFLTVPTVIGYLALGYLVVGALLRTGQFGVQDQWLVYFTLVSYTIGILATSMSRLLQNAFYAIGNTATPARLAVVRVVVSVAVAFPAIFWFREFTVPGVTGIVFESRTLSLGAMGLGAGASVAAWLELGGLLRALKRELPVRVPWARILWMSLLAIVALLPAFGVWWWIPGAPLILLAVAVGGVYAGTYLGLAYLLGFSELDPWVRRFRK